jgi:hypothetical protein
VQGKEEPSLVEGSGSPLDCELPTGQKDVEASIILIYF